jgi:hypothetical protein
MTTNQKPPPFDRRDRIVIMNFRVLIAVLAIHSTGCPAVRAQDHLVPEEAVLSLDEEDWEYAKRLRTVLLKDAPYYHLARAVCLPSPAPEWAVTVVREDADFTTPDDQLKYYVEYVVVDKSLWDPNKIQDVKVKKSRANLDRKTAEAVQEVWRVMLRAVRYPDKDRDGLDGETYRFSRGVPLLDRGRPPQLAGGFEHGQIWSPDDGSMTSELVEIAESLKKYAQSRPEEREKLQTEILAKSNRLKAIPARWPGRKPGTSRGTPRGRSIKLRQALLQAITRGATSGPGIPALAPAARRKGPLAVTMRLALVERWHRSSGRALVDRDHPRG